MTGKLPKVRATDIVMQELDKEKIIYDLQTNNAFALNETLSIIYSACDEQLSFDELKAKNNFSDEIIFLALDELKKGKLLADGSEYTSPFAGMTRREVVKRVGFASMVALPIISALVAPTAAHAASGAGNSGQFAGTVTVSNGTCAGNTTQTSRNNSCNALFSSSCTSGSATNDGTNPSCTDSAPTGYSFPCNCV